MKAEGRKKVLVVIGTRPEAVKLCPVVFEMKKYEGFDVRVCSTGQHREMLAQVFEAFGLMPDIELDVMQEDQELCALTSCLVLKLNEVFGRERPGLVVVQGDTASAYAGALAAFLMKIKVAHVEAGLRTGDMHCPYPEEFFRKSISMMADIHFTPTPGAAENLKREGAEGGSIFVTGNTGIDALLRFVREDYANPLLEKKDGEKLLLLTLHRRENRGAVMEEMLKAMRRIADETGNVKIIFPVHKSPAVQSAAHRILGDCGSVVLTQPLDLPDFQNILAGCDLVVTDSGGVQEEATALGKRALVLRDKTERVEGAAAGNIVVAGCRGDEIYEKCSRMLASEESGDAERSFVYGDGKAGERIAQIIASRYADMV